MIKRCFSRNIASESIVLSRSQFYLVIHALDHAARVLLTGSEVIQNQLAVLLKLASHFLHWSDPGSHDILTPEIEKPSCAGWKDIGPDVLKGFLHDVRSYAAKIDFQELAKSGPLLPGEVSCPFKQNPFRFGQDSRLALEAKG